MNCSGHVRGDSRQVSEALRATRHTRVRVRQPFGGMDRSLPDPLPRTLERGRVDGAITGNCLRAHVGAVKHTNP